MSTRPEYKANHGRVRRARGPASLQACVDCGGQASDWSQIHMTSGTSPEDYEPRCRPCHRAYDSHGFKILE